MSLIMRGILPNKRIFLYCVQNWRKVVDITWNNQRDPTATDLNEEMTPKKLGAHDSWVLVFLCGYRIPLKIRHQRVRSLRYPPEDLRENFSTSPN
jgi:hypothetical protein